MPPRDIVVIGTSAGGISALQDFAAGLPSDFDAPICVVMHVPPYRDSALPEILRRSGPLPAVHPEDGQALENGVIFVAPPDLHLLVIDGIVRLGRGPLENHSRPSVDVLFRSAALAFGMRSIGIVLTGLLGDGTAGMFAIKRRHGVAIVQDPEDAAYGDMPRSVLRTTDVDFRGTVPEIAAYLVELLGRERPPEGAESMDEQMRNETSVAAGSDVGREAVSPYPPSVFSCPDCGGVLWQIEDGNSIERFRCRTGHAYSDESLFLTQTDGAEDALYTAVRALSENAELAGRLSQRAAERGDETTAGRFQERHDNLIRSIQVIRTAMFPDDFSEEARPAAS
jgi:two-component system chemotaxis response regulator CheB